MRVSEIRVNQIRVNQGLGVVQNNVRNKIPTALEQVDFFGQFYLFIFLGCG